MKTEIAVIIAVIITMLFAWVLTEQLRSEVRMLRAEHEAIEQNYCPVCGTYLGESEVDNGNDD